MSKNPPKINIKKPPKAKVPAPGVSQAFWDRQAQHPSGEDLYHTWRQWGPGSVGDTSRR